MTSRYVASPSSRRRVNVNANKALQRGEIDEIGGDNDNSVGNEKEGDVTDGRSEGNDNMKTNNDAGTFNIDAPPLKRSSSSIIPGKIHETMKDCPSSAKQYLDQFIKYEMGDLYTNNSVVKLDDALAENGDEIYFQTELDLVKPSDAPKTIISPYARKLHTYQNNGDLP